MANCRKTQGEKDFFSPDILKLEFHVKDSYAQALTLEYLCDLTNERLHHDALEKGICFPQVGCKSLESDGVEYVTMVFGGEELFDIATEDDGEGSNEEFWFSSEFKDALISEIESTVFPLFEKFDWENAIQKLKESPTKENLKKMMNYYDYMAPDRKKLFHIFKKLAYNHDRNAMRHLAGCYAEGEGTERDSCAADKSYRYIRARRNNKHEF